MGPMAQAISRIAVAKYVNVANKTPGIHGNGGCYMKTLTNVQQSALQTTLQLNPVPKCSNLSIGSCDFRQSIDNRYDQLKPTFDSLLAMFQENLLRGFVKSSNDNNNVFPSSAVPVDRRSIDNFGDVDDVDKKVDEIMSRLGASVKNFVKPMPRAQRTVFVTLFERLVDYVCKLLKWLTNVFNALIALIPGRLLVSFLLNVVIDQLVAVTTAEWFAQIMH